MRCFRLFVILIGLLHGIVIHAQERVTTFGIQMKPIVPSNLFNAGSEALSQNGIDYTIDQRIGHAFGGALRFGITNWFSLESGISYVKRNYTLDLAHQELGNFDTTRFGIVGYEIPISGLVFVRLSDEIYMNTSFGLALDMFPSEVGSEGNGEFFQRSFRRGFGANNSFFNWTKLGLLVNIGFEYRTESSGYFYIGGSYHRPFTPIYDTQFNYTYGNRLDAGSIPITGNYLTLDFRYFFHEEPREKKQKVEERDPSTMPSWMRKD